jgi:hypothetical protein
MLAVIGWTAQAYAEGDVTVLAPPANSTASPQKGAAPDGTPVVHKSLHKKRHTSVAATPSTPAPLSATSAAVTPASVKTIAAAPPAVVAKETAPAKIDLAPTPPPVVPAVATSPTVETGLPVGRYPGMGAPIQGVSTFIPAAPSISMTKPVTGSTTHTSLFAMLPASLPPGTTTATGLYSNPSRTTVSTDDFVFTNFSKKFKNNYPWRTNIITTEFWIGEGDTPISRTTNEASAWDLEWRSSNSGSDNPYNRNGYASGGHASTVNPFYVALPFNDLAFPDKAHDWLPRGWHRPNEDGKQVSACQHRWLEIKNAQGDICYAQWEDVGPLGYEDVEYVFGGARPVGLGDNHAGLDVSPAVSDYLHITDRNRYTSWRFVDDIDVRPGPWLKLDEEAIIYTALHQLKTFHATPVPDLPIQKATEPIEDSSNIDANKRKVSQSKG